jgi:hypothetical protein
MSAPSVARQRTVYNSKCFDARCLPQGWFKGASRHEKIVKRSLTEGVTGFGVAPTFRSASVGLAPAGPALRVKLGQHVYWRGGPRIGLAHGPNH